MNSKIKLSNILSKAGSTRKRRASLFLSLILFVCASFWGPGIVNRYFNKSEISTVLSVPDATSLSVTFLNVGQGNCVIAESKGHYILVDGGDGNHSSFLVSYLKDLGIKTIDYVVISHYDSDHLSGIVGALNNFDVNNIISPDYESDTRTYNSYMSIMSKKNHSAIHPSIGDTFKFGNAQFSIVAPVKYDYEDENNNSIGIRLTDDYHSFLILGDAEFQSEKDILSRNIDLTCDVYLVSHHGSSSSSSDQLLDSAKPSIAVISVGENDYGHPSDTALKRLNDHSVNILRTDQDGTIIAYSGSDFLKWNINFDTKSIQNNVSTNTTASTSTLPGISSGTLYIGNKKSLKFHRLDCTSLPVTNNQVYFDSRQDAINEGYSPCGICKP